MNSKPTLEFIFFGDTQKKFENHALDIGESRR